MMVVDCVWVDSSAFLMTNFGAGYEWIVPMPRAVRGAGCRDLRFAAAGGARTGQTHPQQLELMVRSSDIHRAVLKTAGMVRIFAAAVLLVVLSPPASAVAAQHRNCLSKTEQRAAISHGEAVTLAAAIRSVRGTVRGRGAREVVRARLCRRSGGLVYLLTVLARNGKVTHATVDAATGKVVGAH
jgi:hypothetical protein